MPDSTITQELHLRLSSYRRALDIRGAGLVRAVADDVVQLDGLSNCRYGELIEFDQGAFAIAMNLLDDNCVSAVLLTGRNSVEVGSMGYGTGQVLSVPVGNALLSRIVNPLGQAIDGGAPIRGDVLSPVESPAPSIIDRAGVNKPLETGIIAIDSMIPIGRGQRELIIGDRQTGKTSIAIDTILNQRGKNVKCVYVAIGQKASTVMQIAEVLRVTGALSYTCIVCSTASDSATMQYIAPYTGCAIAEYFMNDRQDALIVYDDLSKHAVAYREMSLLLRRPPGREAYPGDVFYLHSRLLERAARLSPERGGGSLTALPIVETQAGDISAYIPTNVISITDGQIVLDADSFRAGQRPAISIGLSVSRVGGAAQTKAMRKVCGQLRLELAQYRELAVFSQFSSDLDASTRNMLSYGARLTTMLKQKNSAPIPVARQIMLLYGVTRGVVPHDVDMNTLEKYHRDFCDYAAQHCPKIEETLSESMLLTDNIEADLTKAIEAFLSAESGA